MASCNDNIVTALLNRILNWLDAQVRDIDVFSVLQRVLQETFPEWRNIASGAIRNGVAWGLQRLEEVRDTIIEVCQENKELTLVLAKLGGKTAAGAAAKFGAKQLIKVGTRTAAKSMGKTALKCVVKVAWNPYAVASDLAQGALEIGGQRELGKGVGVVGNIGSGAVLGAMVGGPPGAAIGILFGGVQWLTGEFAGNYAEKWIG